jgi:uncharacterized RDD family membrane protein YckC
VTGPEVLRASGTSAGFGRRFAALLYDSLLILALLMVYTLVVTLAHGGAVLESGGAVRWWIYRCGEIAVIGAYCVVNWMHSGQTLGMRAWRLHAVSESGKRLGFSRAALRFVWSLVAWTPAALGVLWIYWDPDHLALQDRLSRTRVVYVPR